MYEYNVKSVAHIVDGDTLDLIVDLGFNITHKIRVRLEGIDTPESRTKDLEEKARGLESKAYFTEMLAKCEGTLIVQTHKKGKYGRYIGTLISDDGDSRVDINRMLIREGYAVEYTGGKK